MKIAILSIVSVLLLCGCAVLQSTPKPGNPDWVNTLVVQMQTSAVGNPPQSIWLYEYKGAIVYYVPPQCCDQYSQLYDASGKLLCAPDGGFTGKGDGKCPDFLQARKDGILIWRDPRSQ